MRPQSMFDDFHDEMTEDAQRRAARHDEKKRMSLFAEMHLDELKDAWNDIDDPEESWEKFA